MSLFTYKQFLNENFQPLFEGGAYGHISHPFEDIDLEIADIKHLISSAVNGTFTPDHFIQEKCLHPETIICLETNGLKTIKEIVDNKINDKALSFNDVTKEIEYAEILNWVKNENTNEWLEIELEDGKKITVTPNHRIYIENIGDTQAKELKIGDTLIVSDYLTNETMPNM